MLEQLEWVAGATTYGLSLLLPNGVSRYVGLFTAHPGPAGGGTEVAVTGYARVAISAWSETIDGEARGRANTAAIEFAAFAFANLAIEAVGIWDAAAAGNLIAWVPITPIEDGLTVSDQLRFVAGDLVIWARP